MQATARPLFAQVKQIGGPLYRYPCDDPLDFGLPFPLSCWGLATFAVAESSKELLEGRPRTYAMRGQRRKDQQRQCQEVKADEEEAKEEDKKGSRFHRVRVAVCGGGRCAPRRSV